MVDGVSALTNELTKSIPSRVRKAASSAMETGADELVAMMRTLVPKDTGRLRDSIGWTWGSAPKGAVVIASSSANDSGSRITVFVGDETTMVGNRNQFQLARLQEFGTQAMRANPFFFSSWRTMKRRIRSRITREINKAIKSDAK